MMFPIGFDHLFYSRKITIDVVENDTVERCGWNGISRGWSYRSSVPKYSLDYCGAIVAESGFFRLPENGVWGVFDEARGSLHNRLVAGCRYEVVVLGKGKAGGERRYPVRQRISRIVSELGCGSETRQG